MGSLCVLGFLELTAAFSCGAMLVHWEFLTSGPDASFQFDQY